MDGWSLEEDVYVTKRMGKRRKPLKHTVPFGLENRSLGFWGMWVGPFQEIQGYFC